MIGVGPDAASAFSVRPATMADLDQVAAIERTVFADPWSRRSFGDLYASRHVRFLVAVDQPGMIIGYAVVLVAGQESELANLAVAGVVQRRGVGRRLLHQAQHMASDLGCTEMFLEVRASNVAALRLYEGMRFEAVGRRARYYARPVEDAIVMRASLPGAG